MKIGLRGSAVVGGVVLMATLAMAQNYPPPRFTGGEVVMGDAGHITIAPNPLGQLRPGDRRSAAQSRSQSDWVMMRGNYEG